jgi:hypothetical protein
VPFRNLIDYLERNHSLDEFLDAFPVPAEPRQPTTRNRRTLRREQRSPDLMPLVPATINAIEVVRPGQVLRVEA